MTDLLALASIPHVLADDEVPFVLGFVPDERRSLDVGDAEIRRGIDRCRIDFKLDPGRLRVLLMEGGDGHCYVMANVGPLLNDWWPMLGRVPADDAARPFLSAGAAQRSVTLRAADTPMQVRVVPPSADFDMTVVVTGVDGALSDENVTFAYLVGLGVIKAALLTLTEYRTLVNPIPDIELGVDGGTIALGGLLDVAAAAAGVIGWQHVPA